MLGVWSWDDEGQLQKGLSQKTWNVGMWDVSQGWPHESKTTTSKTWNFSQSHEISYFQIEIYPTLLSVFTQSQDKTVEQIKSRICEKLDKQFSEEENQNPFIHLAKETIKQAVHDVNGIDEIQKDQFLENVSGIFFQKKLELLVQNTILFESAFKNDHLLVKIFLYSFFGEVPEIRQQRDLLEEEEG